MKKMIFSMMIGLAAAFSVAAGNLVGNGSLSGEGDAPAGWSCSIRIPWSFQNNGGPGGAGMITFSNSGKPGRVVVRQQPMTLVPGEKYRVSVRAKTSNFKADHTFIGVHNAGWFEENGVMALPANTDGWKQFTAEFKLADTTDVHRYGFAVFFNKMTGTVSLADLQLIPLTEKAEKGSKGQFVSGETVNNFITPMVPRLASLPAGTAVIPFAWHQRKNADASLCCIIDKKHTVTLTARDHQFVLSLPKWARTGSHDLHTVLSDKNGKELVKQDFRFGFAPALPKTKVKRYNNLMQEVLNVPGNKTSYDFVNPRDGWVYFRTEGTPRITMMLKGSGNPLIRPEYYRSENQRFLKAGKYTITLDKPVSGNVIVRLVPVIYKYAAIMPAVGFKEAGNFDLAYHRKHVFGVCNVIGKLSDKRYFKEVKERGMEWTDAFHPFSQVAFSSKAQQEMTDKMNGGSLFRNPDSVAVEMDEYFWTNSHSMLMCARSYDGLKNPHGKKIFNWIAGPTDAVPEQIHYDIVSRFFNACGSQGYLAYESYFRPRPTEKEAVACIRNYYDRSLKLTDTVSPGSRKYTGFILGNFQLMPIISLDHMTDVDYRYYLDLQFNVLVNDPKYDGTGIVGYWGCHYADQEMNDWSFALIRHYVLDGRTDMLSAKYGMTYKLSHVKDGDFLKGLSAWKVTGNVKPGKLFGYADGTQRRWGNTKVGDTFALFTGVKGKKNQVSQTITGLIPGKPYKLYYAVGDYKDCKAKISNPRKLLMDCTIEGARITKHLNYVDTYYAKKRGKGTFNMNYVFFTPTKKEHTLTFSDSGTKDGEQLMLNFVKITSHYVPEEK